MRRLRAAWLLASLLAVAAPASAGRIVLVGVDGAAWRVIDGLVAEGALPAFAELQSRGVHAELATVEPVVSPVVWTSLATGRSPNHHGIAGFFTTRRHRSAPTVFERLAGAGLRVGLFEYLVTWPPSPLPGGFVAPGWMRRDPTVWPADLFERAGVEPWRFDYPDTSHSRAEVMADLRGEVRQKPAVFSALLRAFNPDVAAVIFYAVDRASHRFWRDAYPGDFGEGPIVASPRPGSFVREVMTGVDAALAGIVDGMGPDDTLIVASDHGFEADPDRDDPVWVGQTSELLAGFDLDPERDAFQVVGEFGATIVRIKPGPFAEREPILERLVAFFESMQTRGGDPLVQVFVLDGGPRPPEARRPWTNRLYQRAIRLVAKLAFGARFDEPSHAILVVRFDNDRMKSLGPEAEVRAAGQVLPAGRLAFADQFDGKHHETAVFIAAGGPIRALERRQQLSVLDVSSLITYLAGQPLPDDLEGSLKEAWIRADHLAAHPPRVVPAANAPRFVAGPGGAAPSVDDEAMRERLKALGYVR